ERHERGRRIGTASPESGLKGDLLLDLDDDIADLAGLPERCPESRRRLPHQVAVVERYAWSPALQREGPGLLDARQRVVELDRLEHGAQLVIPVGADSEHAKIQVDFRVGSGRQLHALFHSLQPATSMIASRADGSPRRPRRLDVTKKE